MAHARLLGFLTLLAAATAAGAQTVATSPRPDSVAVTIYRDPGRSAASAPDPDWLEGYALVSETRTVTIPAGVSEIRFEGVAGGILPQSAIVSGLPEDVIERNHDAYLLSPASLLDRSLGRRVFLRRTSVATGAVREQQAVIRSGTGGAVVLETADGIEALRCTGQSEALVYPGVPENLPAQPTLSVRARSSRPVTATITLSYLAGGFDWQANYVMTLGPGGDRAELSAWLTLASTDETSFSDAETMAVAGRINREDDDGDEIDPPSPSFALRCWPSGTTSDVPTIVPPAPPPPQPDMRSAAFSPSPVTVLNQENIVVTGSVARQEDLGDVKLYRIPDRVTVASNSQKQVAFIAPRSIELHSVYRGRVSVSDTGNAEVVRYMVSRNRTQEGLGLPLPAGGIVLFERLGERRILIGEGSIADRAIGDDVEIRLNGQEGEVPGLTARIEEEDYGKNWTDYVLVVSNDRPYPIAYEAELVVGSDERLRTRDRLGNRDGRPLWSVTVPANGTARLRYRVREVPDED